MELRLYSLGKDFKTVSKAEILNIKDAFPIVEQHLVNSGYSNLRTKDDGDGSIRFIADPLVGRKGRNVAAVDYY